MGSGIAFAPVIIVGVIVLFVTGRLSQKYKQGNIRKKKTRGAQYLLDSLIPIGMLVGCIIGILISMFFEYSLLYSISLGAGIGYLCGYFAFEIYSKKE